MFYYESKGERDYYWRFTDNTNNNGDSRSSKRVKESSKILANSFLSSTKESPITLLGTGISFKAIIFILLFNYFCN